MKFGWFLYVVSILIFIYSTYLLNQCGDFSGLCTLFPQFGVLVAVIISLIVFIVCCFNNFKIREKQTKSDIALIFLSLLTYPILFLVFVF